MKRLLALHLFIFSAMLFGQADANKGQINGTVLDPKQALVPNAKINIKNVNTNAARQLTSGPDGEFRAVLLDPGPYDVTVEASGFATAELKGVVVYCWPLPTLRHLVQLHAFTEKVVGYLVPRRRVKIFPPYDDSDDFGDCSQFDSDEISQLIKGARINAHPDLLHAVHDGQNSMIHPMDRLEYL